MEFMQYILAILMTLSPANADQYKETEQERSARIEVIAQAISDASAKATCEERFDKPDCEKIWTGSRKELALLLVTKGWWESRFAQNVHAGNCEPYECDPIKRYGVVYHRARTPWQIQRTSLVKPGEWTGMVGTDLKATQTAAWVATRILIRAYNRCGDIEGAIASYGNARSCRQKWAKNRYLFWSNLMVKEVGR